MRITALYTYPVKGCHRIEHDVARVEPWGLAGDRRWLMVDAEGVGITQRDSPLLTQLAVRPRAGGLVLSAPGLPELDVDEPVDGAEELVRVFRHKDPAPARVAEKEWSSAFLGRDARLVWQRDPAGRRIATHALPDDRVSFADGFPVLLANEGSLSAVNDWLAESGEEPVPITRFRPNLVVGGAPAWAEDEWLGRRLRIGDVTFRAAKSCSRCVVTTIDQETGEKGREPLRLLGKRRRFDDGLLFAINLIPDMSHVSIAVGDPVEVLQPYG
ncbi:molybdenum cofactor biosysynthesis protein [Paractinoplanes deccanensis]|uniref:Molybdenum cofactor biosysynthesis protein n=1 Tax=Paractinoplanes deccanensis TaxID=113561 RepID=A0ABQ3Y1J6_9ACTN|nr:MOSC N-terminal beta barrel domain-containing protein [Actinoplanes deccanensis]GID73833.1 molybdenum cofactor biosysynthesis protein [Actinoplanes deccanensis]